MSDSPIPAALQKALDFIVQEAAASGAGLGDCLTDAEMFQEIRTALGFQQADVELLKSLADFTERKAADHAAEPYAFSDVQRHMIAEQGRISADQLRSLASRIASLLPPEQP